MSGNGNAEHDAPDSTSEIARLVIVTRRLSSRLEYAIRTLDRHDTEWGEHRSTVAAAMTALGRLERGQSDLAETIGALAASVAKIERRLGLVETTADAAIDVAERAREGSDAGSIALELAALEVTRRQDSITLRREREREKMALRRAQWVLVAKVIAWATTGGGVLALLALVLRACGVSLP